MTEEIAAAPGWVDDRLDQAFADVPTSDSIVAARRAYLACLGRRKAPAAPSDLLGAETEPCHQALLRTLRTAGIDTTALHPRLEALEAELAEDS